MYIVKSIDEILAKIADRAFLIAFSLNLPILFDLSPIHS